MWPGSLLLSYTAAMNDTSRLALAPHTKDLGGGFTVRRLLPAVARQAVGPFLFFDHFGPVEATPAEAPMMSSR